LIYRFRVQVVKGSENNTADYLSRQGIGEGTDEDQD
jgi:hypothetical protein